MAYHVGDSHLTFLIYYIILPLQSAVAEICLQLDKHSNLEN